MSIGATGRLTVPHDWHSTDYVADWIVHDTARDPERRPRLQSMLAMAPFPRDAALSQVARELEERFGIHHATIQIELADSDEICALTPEHVV